MRNKHRLVIILDVVTTESDNGDRQFEILNKRKVVAEVDIVGLKTQQLAQAQNMIFTKAIELDRQFYDEQKYVVVENNLYEITNQAKGSKPYTMKLDVIDCVDVELINKVVANGL